MKFQQIERRFDPKTNKIKVGFKIDKQWLIFHDESSPEVMKFWKTGEKSGQFDIRNWW